MKHYVDVVTNQVGTPVNGASVTVRVANTASPGTGALATLYSNNGVTSTTNPVTTDALGQFGFYVADGRYDLTISGTGITTKTVGDVEIMDFPAIEGIDPTDGYYSYQTVEQTPTIPSPTYSYVRAFRSTVNANPTANDNTLDFTAGWHHCRTAVANAFNMSALNSNVGMAEHRGSGTLDAAYGQRGYGLNSGSGTINLAIGAAGIAQNVNAGTIVDAQGFVSHVLAGAGNITTGRGIYIKTPYVTSGSIGTSYGIYIENQNVGTTKYSIYTNAGPVRFGDFMRLAPFTFATLPGTPSNGDVLYCSDCTRATPTAGGGTGALVVRLNGQWAGL